MIVRTPTLADLRRFVELHSGRDGATPVLLVHAELAKSWGIAAYGLAEAPEPWPYPSLVLHEIPHPLPSTYLFPDPDWFKNLPANGFVTRLP